MERPVRQYLRRLAATILLFSASYGEAAQIVEVQVEQADGAYHIYFEILVNAPRDRVQDVLSDYEALHEMSPGIISSQLLSGEAGGDAKIDIRLKPCVWVLCRKMRKVSTVTINAYGGIVYKTVPELSDFKGGKEQVIVKASQTPGQTRVTYNASLVPDFFVPPLIGSWLIRKHVIKNLDVSSRRLEEKARL